MAAQAVFDCDDTKKEIFSYLPQYPIITKKMIEKKHLIWGQKLLDRDEKFNKKGAHYIIDNFYRRTKVMPCWEADWLLTLDHIINFEYSEWKLWSRSLPRRKFGGKWRHGRHEEIIGIDRNGRVNYRTP